jgi:hypothetical protein
MKPTLIAAPAGESALVNVDPEAVAAGVPELELLVEPHALDVSAATTHPTSAHRNRNISLLLVMMMGSANSGPDSQRARSMSMTRMNPEARPANCPPLAPWRAPWYSGRGRLAVQTIWAGAEP